MLDFLLPALVPQSHDLESTDELNSNGFMGLEKNFMEEFPKHNLGFHICKLNYHFKTSWLR